MKLVRMVDDYQNLLLENQHLKNVLSHKDSLIEKLKEDSRFKDSTLGKFVFDLFKEQVIILKERPKSCIYRVVVPASTGFCNGRLVDMVREYSIELHPVYEHLCNTRMFYGLVGKCEATGKVYVWVNPEPTIN